MSDRTIKVLIDVVASNSKTVTEAITADVKKASQEQIKAVKEVDKINQQTAKSAEKYSKEQERLDDQLTKQRISNANKAAKQTADAFLRSLRETQAASKSTASETSGIFTKVLGASFFGNLGATAVTRFVSAVSVLPGEIRSVLDEAVKIAEERKNALLGLQTIAEFKGVDATESQRTAQNLRLVRAGIIDVSEASTGLKNLLQTGFGLKESNDLLERFSDSAAFGKQAALSYGEAISSATEGIKNQNSVLVDNAGVTKNISVILKERGFEMEDLSNKTKQQAALEALYKGLMQETAAQVGDADKLTKGYTGTVAGLEQAKKNLYAATGSIITQSPELVAVYKLWTSEINGITDSLERQDSQQRITFANTISGSAKAAIAIENLANGMAAVFQDVMTGFERTYSQFMIYIIGGATGVRAAIAQGVGQPINATIDYVNQTTGSNLPKFDIDANTDYWKKYEDVLTKWQDAHDKYFKTEKGWFQKGTEAQVVAADRWTEFQYLLNESKGLDVTLGVGKRRPKDSGSGDTSGAGRKAKLSEAGIDNFVTDRVKAQFQAAMRKLSPEMRQRIAEMAEQYGIPEALAFAQIFGESSFNTRAQSKVNVVNGKVVGSAFGLTQQLTGTASGLLGRRVTGEELKNNPELNLTAWGKYMSQLFDEFGDWDLATLAYHQGPKTVRTLVRLLDNGTSADVARFFKGRPAGKKYLRQISALSGLKGDDQFKTADEALTDKEKETRERLKNALTILTNAQSIYGTEVIRIPKAVDDIIKAADEVKSWTRQRIVGDKSTRKRIVDPDIPEWALDQQGDPNASRSRVVFGDQIKRSEDYQKSLQDQIEVLRRGGQELTEYDKAQKEIIENYADLTDAQKNSILESAAQVDAQKKVNETFEKTTQFFEHMFQSLRSGGFKGLFKDWLHEAEDFLFKMAAQFAASKLLKWLAPDIFGALPKQQSDGGILGGILGGGGGGQQNASGGLNLGTLFGGNAGGGIMNLVGGGIKGGLASGLLSKVPGLRSLLGAGAGVAAGAGTAAAAGVTTTGGVLGTTIGLEGGGTFTAGAAGAGGLGGLLPLLTNPWTIGIAGAAIGGYFLLKHFFGDKSIRRLKEAAQSQFSIDVKDKNVLTAIKGFGDQQLGKGSSSSNPNGVIRLDDSKNALRNYAEATGQDTNKLGPSQQDLQSEGYAGNRFISKFGGFREFGGPVVAGQSYIVGEKRPEIFTPGTSGTISQVGDGRLMGMVLTAFSALQEEMQLLRAHFTPTTNAAVLKAAHAEDPSIIGDAVKNTTMNDPKFNSDFRTNQTGGVNW